MARPRTRFEQILDAIVDPVVGLIAIGLLRLARMTSREATANCFGFLVRHIGPRLSRHKIGQRNLRASFPEKSPEEIEQILSDVWDNLGRVAAEFAHLDRIVIHNVEPPDPDNDVSYDKRALALLEEVRSEHQAGLFFAAHIANWEIPALIPPLVGLDSYVLYRPPNLRAVNDAVVKLRATCMGTLVPGGLDAPFRLAHALIGGAHVGMLADQQFRRGVEVTFFGRKCKANPLLAQLARRFECPVRGMRVVRLADRNKFRGDVTDPIDLPRDAEGKVDVQGTMQAITSVIEGWVRETPGQWLWLHDRWR